MRKSFRFFGIGLFLSVVVMAAWVWADEQIEMSTYVPAASNTWDRVHAGRATVGDPYSITNPAEPAPPNGTLLVSKFLGIGTADPGSARLSFGPISSNGLNEFDSSSTGVGRRWDILDIWSAPAANQKLGFGVHSGALEIYGTTGNHIMLGERSMSAAGLFTPRLTIQANTGNVGIGTVNPGNTLEVGGVIEAQHAPAPQSHLQVQMGTLSPGGWPVVAFLGNIRTEGVNLMANSADRRAVALLSSAWGAERFFIASNRSSSTQGAMFDPMNYSNISVTIDTANGNVGIGRDPSYPLHVNGVIRSETGFSGPGAPSDLRLKTQMEPMGPVLEDLAKIHGVRFRWNGLYESLGYAGSAGKRDVGVVAQEVEKVFPELVNPIGQSGYKAVDYGRFTAVLLEAVKELKDRGDSLERENRELRRGMDLLRRRTESLEKRL